MRRPVEAVIDDAVVQPDLVAADIRLDAADEMQILAEHRRLLHDAFAPQHAVVAVPGLAIAGQSRRNGADAAVDRMADGLPWAVDIMVGRLVVHEQDMVEAAGHHQPGKGPQPGKPPSPSYSCRPGWRKPAGECQPIAWPLIIAVGDVERPVDQHREAQAGAGAEFEHADAALDAVAQRHQPHAGELRQPLPARSDPAATVSTIKLYHAKFLTSFICRP